MTEIGDYAQPAAVPRIEDGVLYAALEEVDKQRLAKEMARAERDEALVRAEELERQRDQARNAAARLLDEMFAVRQLHRPWRPDWYEEDDEGALCPTCNDYGNYVVWPCDTAKAVYLTDEVS